MKPEGKEELMVKERYEEAEQLKRVAFFGISISTVATLTSIIFVPMLYGYMVTHLGFDLIHRYSPAISAICSINASRGRLCLLKALGTG